MILNPAEVVVRKIISQVTDYVEDTVSFMYAAVEIYYTIMRKNLHVRSWKQLEDRYCEWFYRIKANRSKRVL